MPVIVPHGRVAVIRDDDDPRRAQRVRPLVCIQQAAERRVDHFAQIALLLRQRVHRAVRVQVDAGEVRHLQIRQAVALDRFQHVVDRLRVDLGVGVARDRLVTREALRHHAEQVRHDLRVRHSEDVRAAVDGRQ